MKKILPFLFIYSLLPTCLFSQGTWTQKSSFVNGTQLAVGFSIGNKGYIGTGSPGQNEFYQWDQTTNTWLKRAFVPNFLSNERQGAVGFSIGSKGYIGTGAGRDPIGNHLYLYDFWEWDQQTNIWTQKANFPGNPRSNATGFSIGTKGYIGTGTDGPTTYTDFWEWNQTTNTWKQKANVPGGTRLGAVGFSIGTKGYIGTGQNQATQQPSKLKDFWEWNQATNTWTQKASVGGGGSGIRPGAGVGAALAAESRYHDHQ